MKSVARCLCGATPVLQTRQRNFGLWPDIWQARFICTGNRALAHELCGPWVEAGVGVENDSPALANMAAYGWNNLVEQFSAASSSPPKPEPENTVFLDIPRAVREVVLCRLENSSEWSASAAVGSAHAEQCTRATPQAALRAACRVALRAPVP